MPPTRLYVWLYWQARTLRLLPSHRESCPFIKSRLLRHKSHTVCQRERMRHSQTLEASKQPNYKLGWQPQSTEWHLAPTDRVVANSALSNLRHHSPTSTLSDAYTCTLQDMYDRFLEIVC